jgi:DNA-binding NtrC family response regulator
MLKATPLILIADDQEDIRKSLAALLKTRGYDTVFASDPDMAMRIVGERPLDAVLLDLNYSRDTTSGQEGLELLEAISAAAPQLPVVVMTAWANLDLAVKAMQQGACDFLEKPWDNERLLSILHNQLDLRRALVAVQSLKAENKLLTGTEHIDFIARSTAMEPVLQLVERITAPGPPGGS